MKTKMYHATDFKNCISITEKGILCGVDHCVYCCDEPEDAAKFALMHAVKHILVIAFEVDINDVKESFDHSQAFFKCRAYYIEHDIPAKALKGFTLYHT